MLRREPGPEPEPQNPLLILPDICFFFSFCWHRIKIKLNLTLTNVYFTNYTGTYVVP
jgi:hypothetical protein